METNAEKFPENPVFTPKSALGNFEQILSEYDSLFMFNTVSKKKFYKQKKIKSPKN